MATRRQPALPLQATDLRVKEVMAGGGQTTQAQLVLYSFNIYSNSAHRPPVSAAAGPYVPQRAHPTSENPPGRTAHGSRHGEGDGGAGTKAAADGGSAALTFPAVSNLHRAAAQPQPGTARRPYPPTHRGGTAVPTDPPTATGRLCPATPSQSGGGRTAAPAFEPGKPSHS